MKRCARLLAIAVCLPFLAAFALAEGPFAKLSLAEALAKAGEGKKVVMVDFFTTWCGPCKKLDAETWTDARVNGWLAEHAVAIKLDAEKEKDAAKQHRIGAYPTMLFLKPDGTEVGRLVGFRSPERFLQEAGDLLGGKTPLDTLREKVAHGGENDPRLRQDLGDELAEARRYEEALEQYLWCWDHGLEHDDSYGGRDSFLISSIAELRWKYPPALEALVQRRDACEKSLLEGAVTFRLAQDLAMLNDALDDNASTLRVYDTLRARKDLDSRAQSSVQYGMFDKVRDELLKAGRYQDVLDGVGDYGSAVDRGFQLYEDMKVRLKDDELAAAYMKWNAVTEGAAYYEALLGTGQTDAARALAERLIAFDPREGTFKHLAKRADKVKASDEAAALRERGKQAKQG
jgi:thiol-disulfide isomerase/thioredoxin